MPVCEDAERVQKGEGKSWGSECNEKGKEKESDVHRQMCTDPPCSLLPEQLRCDVAQVHIPAIRAPP